MGKLGEKRLRCSSSGTESVSNDPDYEMEGGAPARGKKAIRVSATKSKSVAPTSRKTKNITPQGDYVKGEYNRNVTVATVDPEMDSKSKQIANLCCSRCQVRNVHRAI